MKRIVAAMMCVFPLVSFGAHFIAEWSVVVVDRDGSVVTNAAVETYFLESVPSKNKVRREVRLMKDDRPLRFKGRTYLPISYDVRREGFYPFFGRDLFSFRAEDGYWLPRGVCHTAILDRIVQPVPMYAKNVGGLVSTIPIPQWGEPFGFDLIEGDWVAPHGKGAVPDFVIKIEKWPVRDKAGNVRNGPLDSAWPNMGFTLTFPRKHDGIQSYTKDHRSGSQIDLVHVAPAGGYTNTLHIINQRDEANRVDTLQVDDSEWVTDMNYIFRVRTTEGAEGDVDGGMYGFIRGDFRVSRHGGVRFKYYLNSIPGHRSLEFGSNLFTPKNDREQEWYPKQTLFDVKSAGR